MNIISLIRFSSNRKMLFSQMSLLNKEVMIGLLLTFFVFSCQRNKTQSGSKTKVEIKNKVFDFGAIEQSEEIEHSFIIKNVGKMPLIITSVETSCGCTLAEWTTLPIAPTKQAVVKVKFRPYVGSVGRIDKSIIVQSNTDSIFNVLHLTGLVKK